MFALLDVETKREKKKTTTTTTRSAIRDGRLATKQPQAATRTGRQPQERQRILSDYENQSVASEPLPAHNSTGSTRRRLRRRQPVKRLRDTGSSSNSCSNSSNNNNNNYNRLKTTMLQSRRTRIVERALLGAIVALAVCSLQNYSQASANHAISEVWSEADGLRVKYATDHMDVLGAKGSELSLSSGQNEQKAPATEAQSEGASGGGGGGVESSDESSASTGSSSSSEVSGGGGGSGEGSASSAGDGSGSDSSEGAGEPSAGSGDESSNEQGADSARQTEKVAPDGMPTHKSNSWAHSKRVGSGAGERSREEEGDNDDSADGSAIRQKTGKSTAVFGSATAKQSSGGGGNGNDDDDEPSSFNEHAMRSKSGSAAAAATATAAPGARNEEFNGVNAMSYSAMLEQAGVGDESELSSADVGPASTAAAAAASARQSEASARFRQPSKSFREAIRMGSSEGKRPVSSEEGSSFLSFDGSGGGGGSSSSGDEADSGGSKRDNNNNNNNNNDDDDDGKESSMAAGNSNGGSNENDGYESRKQTALRARDNMIDFDRVAGKSRASGAAPPRPFGANEDGRNGESGGGGGDDESGLGAGEPPSLSSSSSDEDDTSGRVGVGGRGNDEETRGSSRVNYHSPGHQYNRVVAGGFEQRASSTTARPARLRAPAVASQNAPDSYRKLAYFRSVGATQAAPSASRGRSPQQVRGGYDGSELQSPDSVRDNFISPGHFPGSMPHLTHAASETQKKQIAPVEGSNQQQQQQQQQTSASAPKQTQVVAEETSSQPARVAPSAPQQQTPTAATATNQLVASDTLINNQVATLDNGAGKSSAVASEFVVAVTPEPSAQSESQQIMAPTMLLSTTTMAPMSTTTTTSTSTTSTSTTTGAPALSSAEASPAGASTTQAPSLKRFKFRKYR